VKELRRFLVVWTPLFLVFFLVVSCSVWVNSHDSPLPPPGEYPVSEVTKLSSPYLNWYEISFNVDKTPKTLKISPTRLGIKTVEGLSKATFLVSEQGTSLQLPPDFVVDKSNVLFEIIFAALVFSFTAGMLYTFYTHTLYHIPQSRK